MSFFGRGHYRLPSEGEWEYAARAGKTTPRYWGEAAEEGCTYENMADLSFKKHHPDRPDKDIVNCNDGFYDTAPVGSFKPNPFGLYVMLGNVGEWVDDCYAENYQDTPKDGSPLSKNDCSIRVVRGGDWWDPANHLRAAFRWGGGPKNTQSTVGFRLVRTIAP